MTIRCRRTRNEIEKDVREVHLEDWQRETLGQSVVCAGERRSVKFPPVLLGPRMSLDSEEQKDKETTLVA